MSAEIAAGIVDHCGWANVVALKIDGDAPVVADRRRVELIDPDLPAMPHEHEAFGLPDDEAEALIAQVRTSAEQEAQRVLDQLRAELAPSGQLVAIGVRDEPAVTIPERYAEVRAYRPALYAADGELYRRAIADAADELGLAVVLLPRRDDAIEHAAWVLGTTVDHVRSDVAAAGKVLGSPWNKEHRRAAAMAMAALGNGTGPGEPTRP